MSESRDFILGQLQGGQPGFEAPSDEQQRYLEGAPAAEDRADDQNEEQAPWMADEAFFDALTDAAQADMLAGADMSAEFDLWTRGEVDAGEEDDDEELPPAAPAELPPSADEAAAYAQQWADLGRAGGDGETSPDECSEQAQAWRAIAREVAVSEAHVGRRQSWDLSPEDERDVLQDEIDRRVAAGRERWGADR